MNQFKSISYCIGLLILISSCNKEVLVGNPFDAKIIILSGQDQTDTANFTLKEPIIFKIIDSISGVDISMDSFNVRCTSKADLLSPLKDLYFSNYEMRVDPALIGNAFKATWQLHCSVGTQTLNIAVSHRRSTKLLTSATVKATALPTQKSVETPCSFGEAPTNAVFRQPDGTLYIGLEKKFLKSVDGGINWQNIELPKVGVVTKIQTLGDKILINIHSRVGNINVTEFDDLYFSNDGGVSWKNIGSSANNRIFGNIDKVSITKQGKLLFHSSFQTYMSNDNGSTWNKIIQESHYTFFDDNLGNLYYFDTNYYLYSSKNNGQTWAKNALSNDFTPILDLLKEDNSDQILAIKNFGTGSKIYRSTDSGGTWTNIATTTFQINWMQQVGNIYFARTGIKTLRLDANFNILDTVAPSTDYSLCTLIGMMDKKLIRIHDYLPTLIYHLK